MRFLDILRDALNHLNVDEQTAQTFIDSRHSTYADLEAIYNSMGNNEKVGGFANPIMNKLSDAIAERVLGQVVDDEE
jgi:hypothetical protein